MIRHILFTRPTTVYKTLKFENDFCVRKLEYHCDVTHNCALRRRKMQDEPETQCLFIRELLLKVIPTTKAKALFFCQ